MKQTGFSLVELMIGLAVLMAVITLGIPGFKNSVGNGQIKTVAESIKNGLQLARLEAIKRNTKIKFTLSSNSAWSYGCNTITNDCPSTIQSKNANEGSSSNIALTITSGSNLIFNSFGLRDSASTITQVEVKNIGMTDVEQRELRVMVNTGGNAKICDPDTSIPTGDPRKC